MKYKGNYFVDRSANVIQTWCYTASFVLSFRSSNILQTSLGCCSARHCTNAYQTVPFLAQKPLPTLSCSEMLDQNLSSNA